MMTTITYSDLEGIQKTLEVNLDDQKPRFLIPFDCHRVEGKRWWILDADWLWFNGKYILRVRRGFGWNGTSVPSIVKWYENPGDHLAASCPHDDIYTYHWIEVWDVTTSSWVMVRAGKGFADKLFNEIYREHYNIRITKTYVLYGAVHLFGYWAWYTDVCNGKCNVCRGVNSENCPFKGILPNPIVFVPVSLN